MMPHDWTYWSRSLPPNWRRTGTHTVQKRHSQTHTYKCCEFDNILYESNGHFLMCVWCSYFTWSTSSFLLFQRLSRTFDFVCIFGRIVVFLLLSGLFRRTLVLVLSNHEGVLPYFSAHYEYVMMSVCPPSPG